MRAQRELTERQAFAEALLDALGGRTVVIGVDGRVRAVNARYEKEGPFGEGSGSGPDVGADALAFLDLLAHGTPGVGVVADAVRNTLAGSGTRQAVDVPGRDGTWTAAEVHPFLGPGGGALVSFVDVSERKAHELELAHQATHDSLTELPNRALMLDRLRESLGRAHRRGQPMAVLFVDLDGLKQVNDTVGHDAGDDMICAAAERLAGCCRVADTVARLGGDEFVVLLDEIADAAEAEALAQRMLTALRTPGTPSGGRYVGSLSASIGVALADGLPAPTETDARDLVGHADAAMLVARRRARTKWCFWRVLYLRAGRATLSRVGAEPGGVRASADRPRGGSSPAAAPAAPDPRCAGRRARSARPARACPRAAPCRGRCTAAARRRTGRYAASTSRCRGGATPSASRKRVGSNRSGSGHADSCRCTSHGLTITSEFVGDVDAGEHVGLARPPRHEPRGRVEPQHLVHARRRRTAAAAGRRSRGEPPGQTASTSARSRSAASGFSASRCQAQVSALATVSWPATMKVTTWSRTCCRESVEPSSSCASEEQVEHVARRARPPRADARHGRRASRRRRRRAWLTARRSTRLVGVGTAAASRSGVRAFFTTMSSASSVASASRSASPERSEPNSDVADHLEREVHHRLVDVDDRAVALAPARRRACRWRVRTWSATSSSVPWWNAGCTSAALRPPRLGVGGEQPLAGDQRERRVLQRALAVGLRVGDEHAAYGLGVGHEVGRRVRDRELQHVAVRRPHVGQEAQRIAADRADRPQHLAARGPGAVIGAGRVRGTSRSCQPLGATRPDAPPRGARHSRRLRSGRGRARRPRRTPAPSRRPTAARRAEPRRSRRWSARRPWSRRTRRARTRPATRCAPRARSRRA